ncbi:hypothetical protein ABTZ78_28895 [Streptomyces bauhiniae]|uniref:hypothetical protein n=1 Tax=Streptomyces bauhiniae TaxID=2340725 RepID=UPI00331B7B9D
MKALLNPPGVDFDTPETSALWDEQVGTVSAGVNWASDVSSATMGERHITVIGPAPEQAG